MATSLLRKSLANDNQPDFFVPDRRDIAIKGRIGLMDVVVFRLVRNNSKASIIIQYRLGSLTVQVKSNYDGTRPT